MVGMLSNYEQNLETQQRVCMRLPEFTHIKGLQPGCWARVHESNFWDQWDICLNLTLVAGLDLLGGLIPLQELEIVSLQHHINYEQEMKWKVEHWPRLYKIHGLGRHTEAYRWIRKNHPKIQLE